MDKKQFAIDLEREAEGLRWLGKELAARTLAALARIVRASKIDSVNDLELWANHMEKES